MSHSSYKRMLLAASALAAIWLPYSVHAQEPASPATAQTSEKADVDMQRVLDTHASLNPKPIETLSPSEARKQPTLADAVAKILKDENSKLDPHQGLKISNSRFADMGNLRLRFYTPESATKDSNLPVVLYFRGGGWVIADSYVYDSTPSAFAPKANVIVVSADYPMAPEKKFPAAHDEAVDAYKYVLKNAKGWGGDPAKVALFGESAGGNLGVATSLAARDQNLTKPVAVIAIYPVATTSMDTPAKKVEANAKPLNTAMVAWFFDKVLPGPEAKQDVRLNLVSANLSGLPPVTIINAQIDPLRSDGEMLGEKLKDAGNDVTQKTYTGVTHEFFGMDALVAKAKEAQEFSVSQLKKANENM